jgi:hypothetical protein
MPRRVIVSEAWPLTFAISGALGNLEQGEELEGSDQ